MEDYAKPLKSSDDIREIEESSDEESSDEESSDDIEEIEERDRRLEKKLKKHKKGEEKRLRKVASDFEQARIASLEEKEKRPLKD
jgi:hypothetical protein